MGDDDRPYWVPGLLDIDGIGVLCDTCDNAACDDIGPPHARYLQAILKVSRPLSELIAAYAYPVYAKATTSVTHPSVAMPDG